MIPRMYQTVLRLLLRRIPSGVNWAITGSMGFVLQGMPVDVGDIDIQTDTEGAYIIEALLKAYSVRKVAHSSSENVQSHFGALRIHDVEVEIMGALQKQLPDGTCEAPVDPAAHVTYVDYEGFQVPCLSLDYEADAYERMDRKARAKLIRRHLGRPAGMVIRQVSGEELRPAADLHVAVFSLHPWNEPRPIEETVAQFEKYAASPGFAGYVAEQDGDIVGGVIGRMPAVGPAKEYRISELFVAPAYQRQGIGELLVLYLIDKAEKIGAQRVAASTLIDTPASAFYRKLGFTDEGPTAYDPGKHEFRMSLE